MSSSNSRQDSSTNTDAAQASHRSLRRWIWCGVLGFLVFDGLAVLHQLLVAPDTIDSLKIFGDVNNTLGWCLAVLFCISRLPRAWWKRETRAAMTSTLQTAQLRIPFWIGIVFSINAIERGIYMYYDMVHIVPLFDWPSIFLLLRYPFLFLAALSLFRHSLSFIARVRLAFDGFLILTALISFSWYFLLGPLMLEGHESIVEKMGAIPFPLSDLILCFYVFQLSFRNSEPAFRLVRSLFSSGLLGIVIADIFDIAQYLQASPLFPVLQNLVLCLGYILIALAVQALHNINTEQYAPIDKARYEETASAPAFSLFLWQSLLSSACVPLVLFFMVLIWSAGGTGSLALGVYLAGIALISQLAIRQILVMYEAFLSNQALQHTQKEVRAKNLALTQANCRLEEQAQELATAYEQQSQTSKLKDQFLLSVNHELRTPLTEMHGYLELLHYSPRTIDAETYERFLSHALNGSQELQRLVDTILDTLRSEHAREALHSEAVAVISVVQEVVELFDPRKREEYNLNVTVPAELMVQADRQYVHQILSNLLSNAFKYSPPRTTIVVGAQAVPTSTLSTGEPSHVYIWVQDYGPGIPPESISFLFGKFFRLPRHQTSSIRGTGLGLYICKQLVEAMNGRIWVESSGIPGEGSRFCFSLPATLRPVN